MNERKRNYIEKVKALLDKELEMKTTDYRGLLDVYALLVLTVGVDCTNENIHDAWSVWQNYIDPTHRSLKPFDQLTKEVQDLDEPYREAVVKVAGILTQQQPQPPKKKCKETCDGGI